MGHAYSRAPRFPPGCPASRGSAAEAPPGPCASRRGKIVPSGRARGRRRTHVREATSPFLRTRLLDTGAPRANSIPSRPPGIQSALVEGPRALCGALAVRATPRFEKKCGRVLQRARTCNTESGPGQQQPRRCDSGPARDATPTPTSLAEPGQRSGAGENDGQRPGAAAMERKGEQYKITQVMTHMLKSSPFGASDYPAP